MLKQKSEKALVMVVDDEEGVRKLVRGALELAGFRVIEARDGFMQGFALSTTRRQSISSAPT